MRPQRDRAGRSPFDRRRYGVASVVAVGALAVSCGSGSAGEAPSATHGGRVGAAAGAPVPDDRCDLPRVHPGYLPWIPAGAVVPPPTEVFHGPDPGSDMVSVTWFNGSAPDPYYVALRVYTDVGPGVGRPSGVRLGRVEGSLYRGETGGAASIIWDNPRDRCNITMLDIAASDMTGAQAERVAIRVADSLE